MPTLIAPRVGLNVGWDWADPPRTDAPQVRRWAGGFGVAAGLLLVAAMPIYVTRSVPPSLDDAAAYAAYLGRNNAHVLTGVVVDTLYVTCFVGFLAGLSTLVRHAKPAARPGSPSPGCEWLSALLLGAGLLGSAVALLGDALAGAAALDTYGRADPTLVRTLIEASLPAFGAIGPVLMPLFLAPTGYATLVTGVLPPWTSWLA